MVFAQESIKRFFEDHGEKTLAEGGGRKGTLIFTGTLVSLSVSFGERLSGLNGGWLGMLTRHSLQGALRCNAEFGSYGASRGSVRQLAQALAKEMSAKGVHVAVCCFAQSCEAGTMDI